jgi:ubiquinone/menaquinone biosynthesis C-methylase UbiE
MEKKVERIESIKNLFDNISPYFDSWAEVFQEKVYEYVTWKHLKKHIPEDKNSLILDAGGGTGRWAIPLAKMGYSVILCDISKGMLKQAEKNIDVEKLSDKIVLKEEDLTDLSFPDQLFDFVLCEDGPISISDSQKVIRELRRVLKKGGKLWACVLGRYPFALAKVKTNSKEALKLIKRELNYISYKGLEKNRVFSPKEIQNLLQENGIEVIELYGNRIVAPLLSSKIRTMTEYDDEFYSEIRDLELHLSEEPSLLGLSEYLQIVGRK